MKEDILGYPVTGSPLEEVVGDICKHIVFNKKAEGPRMQWLACLNPHSYVVACKDDIFAQALNNAKWLIPDGVGICLASRFLGGSIRRRLTGSDVFYALNRQMDVLGGLRVFFLGASEEVLVEICSRMALDYPAVEIGGVYSPPFKPEFSPADVERMIQEVNSTASDVLWVGLTAPKQEKWLYENQERLNVKFAGAVGAVFDFYSGRIKRSHPLLQRLGLEWLPRLVRQPRRLWRRTMVSAPVFCAHVVRRKIVMAISRVDREDKY